VSVQWRPEEEQQPGQDWNDLVDDLDQAFFLSLQGLLDWDSQGMSTRVVIGSKDIFSPDEGGARGIGRRPRLLHEELAAVAPGGAESEAETGTGTEAESAAAGDSDPDVTAPSVRLQAWQLWQALMGSGSGSGSGRSDRRLKAAQWDSFTLGVWTTADGSLAEVGAEMVPRRCGSGCACVCVWLWLCMCVAVAVAVAVTYYSVVICRPGPRRWPLPCS
jgi:hypothetical protein